MRAKVVVPFYDLMTGLGNVPENTYRAGDVFEGSPERVGDLVQKGFVKEIKARKREPKKQA